MIFKNNFAKLFDFKKHQLLVTKEFDEGNEDGKEFHVLQRVEFANFKVNISIMAKTEEQRDEVFNNYDHKMASDFMKWVLDAAKKAEVTKE